MNNLKQLSDLLAWFSLRGIWGYIHIHVYIYIHTHIQVYIMCICIHTVYISLCFRKKAQMSFHSATWRTEDHKRGWENLFYWSSQAANHRAGKAPVQQEVAAPAANRISPPDVAGSLAVFPTRRSQYLRFIIFFIDILVLLQLPAFRSAAIKYFTL